MKIQNIIQTKFASLLKDIGALNFGIRRFYPGREIRGFSLSESYDKAFYENQTSKLWQYYRFEIEEALNVKKVFLRIGLFDRKNVLHQFMKRIDVWNTVVFYRKRENYLDSFFLLEPRIIIRI